MRGRVRAKFRCLGITQRWDGSWIVELGPVMQRGKHSKENEQFWSASPSGECHLTYQGEHPFKAGDYYYLDMGPNDEGDWTLGSVTDNGEGSGEVFFSVYHGYDYQKPIPKGMRQGNFKIGIDGDHTDALKTFGTAGSSWDVSFVFAESSDD